MRGRGQVAAELDGQGGGREAGQDQQGHPWRAAAGGQFPGDTDSGGDSTRAVRDKPQEVAEPPSGRRWRWWRHGTAFLLLKTKVKQQTVEVTFEIWILKSSFLNPY